MLANSNINLVKTNYYDSWARDIGALYLINYRNHTHFVLLWYLHYLLWEHQLVLKEYDYYDVNNISKGTIIAGPKFLNAKVKLETTFLGYYDGISQTSALAFIYLVANNIIPPLAFEKAITHFLTNHYALMKINQGDLWFFKATLSL